MDPFISLIEAVENPVEEVKEPLVVKYYADAETGAFLGGTDNEAPANSVEVPCPEHGKQIWNGKEWTTPSDLALALVYDERRTAYDANGATLAARVDAMWDKLVLGDTTAFEAIEAVRQNIKQQFPKPQ